MIEPSLLSRRHRLALAFAAEIALRAPSPMSPLVPRKIVNDAVAARDRLLEPVLQALVHAQIFKSARGKQGGYALARPPSKISLGEIVRVVDSVSTAKERQYSPAVTEIVDRMLDYPMRKFREALDAITLADLSDRAVSRGRIAYPAPGASDPAPPPGSTTLVFRDSDPPSAELVILPATKRRAEDDKEPQPALTAAE